VLPRKYRKGALDRAARFFRGMEDERLATMGDDDDGNDVDDDDDDDGGGCFG